MKAPELPGYERFGFSAEIGSSASTFLRPVYTKGASGPAVIILHEGYGMGAPILELADDLVAAGYRVYLPLIFGRPGAATVLNIGRAICLRRLFGMFDRRDRTPALVEWVRLLADDIAADVGGPVAVIGQCLTGSLVIGTVHHPSVGAVVAAQPATPVALTSRSRERVGRIVGVSSEDLAAAAASEGSLMSIRYTGDHLCPRDRVEALADAFGGSLAHEPETGASHQRIGGLEIVELAGDAHSTLGEDRHGAAFDAVVDFLGRRLFSPVENPQDFP